MRLAAILLIITFIAPNASTARQIDDGGYYSFVNSASRDESKGSGGHADEGYYSWVDESKPLPIAASKRPVVLSQLPAAVYKPPVPVIKPPAPAKSRPQQKFIAMVETSHPVVAQTSHAPAPEISHVSVAEISHAAVAETNQTDDSYEGSMSLGEFFSRLFGGGHKDYKTAKARAPKLVRSAKDEPAPVEVKLPRPVRPCPVKVDRKLPKPVDPATVAAATPDVVAPTPNLMKVFPAKLALAMPAAPAPVVEPEPPVVPPPVRTKRRLNLKALLPVQPLDAESLLDPIRPEPIHLAPERPPLTAGVQVKAQAEAEAEKVVPVKMKRLRRSEPKDKPVVAHVDPEPKAPEPVPAAPPPAPAEKPRPAPHRQAIAMQPQPVAPMPTPPAPARSGRGGVMASVRISQDAQAKLNADKSIELRSGDLILSANTDTQVHAGNSTITIARDAIAFVSYRDQCVKVRNLCDMRQGSVFVAVCGRHVPLAPGQELVAGPNMEQLTEAAATDSVGRRRLKSFQVDGGDSMLVCEYSPITLVKSCALLKTVSDGDSARDKQVFDRVLKMAACLQIATGGHGDYATVTK